MAFLFKIYCTDLAETSDSVATFHSQNEVDSFIEKCITYQKTKPNPMAWDEIFDKNDKVVPEFDKLLEDVEIWRQNHPCPLYDQYGKFKIELCQYELSSEGKSVHFETYEHINEVRKNLTKCIKELLQRSEDHDISKIYSDEESELFVKYTPLLKTLKYGSPEYTQSLENLKPALDHHYKTYRHHPEHFENGINDMTLIDIFEMLCDWVAASKRTKNGNVKNSIEISAKRFGINDQLKTILENTAKQLGEL